MKIFVSCCIVLFFVIIFIYLFFVFFLQVAFEAMGVAPPGSSSHPAVDRSNHVNDAKKQVRACAYTYTTQTLAQHLPRPRACSLKTRSFPQRKSRICRFSRVLGMGHLCCDYCEHMSSYANHHFTHLGCPTS